MICPGCEGVDLVNLSKTLGTGTSVMHIVLVSNLLGAAPQSTARYMIVSRVV